MGKKPAEWPILFFSNQEEWERWLEANCDSADGVRLKLAKKQTGEPSLTYEEAVEGALCFGWIDSQKEALDETSWIQRFSPRGPRSIWSQINKEKAERLIASGRMREPGLRAVERARENGKWDAAYASQSKTEIPTEWASELAKHPRAQSFFETLDSRNRYAILFRIQTAKKEETRRQRIEQFVSMLEKGETIYGPTKKGR
ncbi:YdeI/OmpD-associated family protein [Brevibacillus fluminis]|uniref:YdeI/OmpD-associated family protein n=1 Tax=Brevibacillus fluminis TaxID=511487 RepID=UPI003F8B68D1